MKTYKYTDPGNVVVHIIDEDGISRGSCLASILTPGTVITPADPVPNPRIAEIQARLSQIDIESIRALRAKMLNRGKPADDTKLTTLEDEANALRQELGTL